MPAGRPDAGRAPWCTAAYLNTSLSGNQGHVSSTAMSGLWGIVPQGSIGRLLYMLCGAGCEKNLVASPPVHAMASFQAVRSRGSNCSKNLVGFL